MKLCFIVVIPHAMMVSLGLLLLLLAVAGTLSLLVLKRIHILSRYIDFLNEHTDTY